MTVTDCLVGTESLPAGVATELTKDNPSVSSTTVTSTALAQLQAVGGICNGGEFDATTLNQPLAERRIIGDATDQAVLRFAEGLGSVALARSNWKKLYRLPFNSKNKYMVHVAKDTSKGDKGGIILMIKGAPDILMARCTHYMTGNGSTEPLTDAHRKVIENQKDAWSADAKRVILMARKTLPVTFESMSSETQEFEDAMAREAASGLELVGLVGIVDPPRDEIPEVVRTLRGAGVRVFMVTGDFKLTAHAIARACGIVTQAPEDVDDINALGKPRSRPLSPGMENIIFDNVMTNSFNSRALVLSGSELNDLEEDQWDALCEYDEIVFARTTPDQKLRIVKELQKREQIVGMTGDGVNDAPSLKEADIGIAMGSGSDIAIEAADMVLLDSFSAIVEALKYGRVVFENLKKTICYLLPAGSFSEFWPVITNVVFGLPQVLSSFLMIIICCFTDCAAAIAIAYEKPEADVLLRPPRDPRRDRLVNWKLLVHAYGFLGILMTVTSFAMGYWYMERKGIPFSILWFGFGDMPEGMKGGVYNSILYHASSIYFINLVVMQWFNLLAVRTRRLSLLQHPPLFRRETANWYLFPAVIFSLLIAIFFLYVPKFQEVLDTTDVPVEHWFLPMAFGMGILLLDEARKWAVRKNPQGLLGKMAW
jgi:sodium/potassium-transporting ATPase subunit alpha